MARCLRWPSTGRCARSRRFKLSWPRGALGTSYAQSPPSSAAVAAAAAAHNNDGCGLRHACMLAACCLLRITIIAACCTHTAVGSVELLDTLARAELLRQRACRRHRRRLHCRPSGDTAPTATLDSVDSPRLPPLAGLLIDGRCTVGAALRGRAWRLDGSLVSRSWPGAQSSRRRDCHFTDISSPSMLKHLLKVEGDAAE